MTAWVVLDRGIVQSHAVGPDGTLTLCGVPIPAGSHTGEKPGDVPSCQLCILREANIFRSQTRRRGQR